MLCVCVCVCVCMYVCIYIYMYIYNGILLSHKKEQIGLFVETWINLQFVIQSHISQKEKSKYHILMHIYGI